MALKKFLHLTVMTLIKCITLKYLRKKSLSLFHNNACFLNRNFDDFQHLLSSTKKVFDIIAVSETRITKQVSLLNNLNFNNYLLNLLQPRLLQVVPIFTLLITYRINVVMT